MTRKFFLLPVALLLLGGCSQTDQPTSSGIVPPGNQIDQIVEAIKNTTEYKTEYDVTLSMDDSFPLEPSISARQSRIIHGLARVKGLNSGINGDDQSMKMKFEVSLSEYLAAIHCTLTQLREMLESDPKQFESYEIDESNDYLMLLMDTSKDGSVPHEWQYIVKDEGSSQYKIGEFYQNYLLRSEYLSVEGSTDNYYSLMNPLVDVIKENKASVTYSDNVYSVDISANPVDLGYGQSVSKVSLKPSNNEYVVGYEGQIAEGPIQMDVEGEFRIHDINHSELTIPDFTVFCPFDHNETWQYVRYSDTQHIKVCAYCHQYIGQPENHSMNEEHGVCVVCETHSQMPRDVSYFNDKLSTGTPYLNGYRRPNGKYYGLSITPDGAIYGSMISLSGVTGPVLACFYAGEDNILALQYDAGSATPLDGCVSVSQQNVLVFKNVALSFTPEQQAIIDQGNPSEVSQVYGEVLALEGSTLDAIKTRFTVTDEYHSYTLMNNHKEGEDHTFTPEGSCFEASYAKCEREGCEQCVYAHGDYYHQYQINVINKPTWGEDDQVYFTFGECSHCHDHNPFIGSIEKSDCNYHESLHIYITEYDSDGNPHRWTSTFLPHIDNNNDQLCDLCGSVKLSLTYNDKVYSMYFDGDEMKSYHYWEDYSTEFDPGDHYSVKTYQLSEDETILATITIDTPEEGTKIQYTMQIGDSSYVSPAYDWRN